MTVGSEEAEGLGYERGKKIWPLRGLGEEKWSWQLGIGAGRQTRHGLNHGHSMDRHFDGGVEEANKDGQAGQWRRQQTGQSIGRCRKQLARVEETWRCRGVGGRWKGG